MLELQHWPLPEHCLRETAHATPRFQSIPNVSGCPKLLNEIIHRNVFRSFGVAGSVTSLRF
jgi:hypothetical protein